MDNRQKKVTINICNNVKALRERAHLSQEEFANFLEVDLDYVKSLENGDQNISTVKLERISELFGCPTDLLLKEEIPAETFDYAFYTVDGQEMDLKTIAAINRVALNLLEMQRLQSIGEKFHSDRLKE
ncbi:MAG: helix-turn-helix transcriptional regulator [Anaerolineae bacterium]|nr:helix-turn-helix transcriptional regulator [Anaerolineae bacterium]